MFISKNRNVPHQCISLLTLALSAGFAGLVGIPVIHAEIESDPQGAYILGVEDRLSIRVWGEPDLSMEVMVRPDGMITFPLVGDILAEGRTASNLAGEIEKQLRDYLQEPLVAVVVDQINSFQVYLLGEFNNQGVQTIRRKIKLLQVIAIAGGLTEFADKSNLVLIREVAGTDTRMRIDYRKLVSGAKPELNLEIKPGDVLLATD